MKKLLAVFAIASLLVSGSIAQTPQATVKAPVERTSTKTNTSVEKKKGSSVSNGIVQKNTKESKACCQKPNASCCKNNAAAASKSCTAEQKAACAKAGKECSHPHAEAAKSEPTKAIAPVRETKSGSN